MNEKAQTYQVVDLPGGRRLMANANNLYWGKHFMYGLLEVDVTVARKFIEEYRAQTGELLSFTGYLTYCLARAVDENKDVQAYKKGRKQLVLYDDVDVALMIEQKVGDKRALMGHVIREANHRTYREIHDEIRAVQSKPTPASRGMPPWLHKAMLLPWPLSSLFNWLLDLAVHRDPTIFTSMAGTVSVTAVGMFGQGQSGWGLVPLTNGLNLIVGGIAWKPAVIEGRIEPRQMLNLTVMFDHDIIDGAPAARFTRRLVELIESGCGLDERL
jgi:pyruvate/2-oxoglutarate dehydrogenase complex dihydrolipoamide acyltransferase (E2) component